MVGKCHERVPSGGVAGEAGQALGWGSTLTQTEMKERNAENNFGANKVRNDRLAKYQSNSELKSSKMVFYLR